MLVEICLINKFYHRKIVQADDDEEDNVCKAKDELDSHVFNNPLYPSQNKIENQSSNQIVDLTDENDLSNEFDTNNTIGYGDGTNSLGHESSEAGQMYRKLLSQLEFTFYLCFICNLFE